MNQILYISASKKNNTLEIKTIVRIFCISLILFGVVLLGKGSFAVISNISNGDLKGIPVVTMNQQSSRVYLTVKHDKAIDTIIYYWNNKQENIIIGRGRLEIKQKIKIPKNNDKLTVKVTDIDGKTVTYTKKCEVDALDVIEPKIDLVLEGSKLKIIAKDETEMDYIKFFWNNEDETKIEATDESPKQIEETVTILKGDNTLTVIAVDRAGNEITKEQTYRGAKKPVIELYTEGQDLLVKVTDEEEVIKVEYTVNGVQYSTDPENTGNGLGLKEVEFKQPLTPGENIIIMKAYGKSGLVEEFSGQANI